MEAFLWQLEASNIHHSWKVNEIHPKFFDENILLPSIIGRYSITRVSGRQVGILQPKILLEDVDGDNVKWQGLDEIGDAGPRKKPEEH